MKRMFLVGAVLLASTATAQALGGAPLTTAAKGRTILVTQDQTLNPWLLTLNVATPPGTYEVIPERCPPGPGGSGPASACVTADKDGPKIYLPRFSSEEMKFHVLAHELGHVFDIAVLTDADREEFMRLTEMSGKWQANAAADRGHNSPNEIFAEVYGQCARSTRDRRGRWRRPFTGIGRDGPIIVNYDSPSPHALTNREMTILCASI